MTYRPVMIRPRPSDRWPRVSPRAGRAVGFLGHDLGDQAIEGRDAGRRLAPAEHLGPMHVPGGEVGPRATPGVLVFDVHGAPRGGRERGMNPEPSLDTGFLVGRQN